MELKDNPPAEPQFNKLIRTILSDQPRVTKFKINWDIKSKNKANESPENNSQTNCQELNA